MIGDWRRRQPIDISERDRGAGERILGPNDDAARGGIDGEHVKRRRVAADTQAAALAVCEHTRVFTLGESLGGVESLIEHPGRMTHASVAGTDLEVPADLVRLSVGIESVDDLVADLDQALSSALSR